MSFKIWGIKIKISFLFFAMLTMVFAMDEKRVAIVTLLSVALHETGHIVALLCFKAYPEEITFGIFGIRILQNKCKLSYSDEAVVVLCGPAVNIVLFVIFGVLNYTFENQILLIISAVNLVVGIFNLLPVLPLDGGRALLVVLNSFFSEKAVQRIMVIVGVLFATTIILLGCFLAFKTGANFSLLATGLYLGIICVKSVRI